MSRRFSQSAFALVSLFFQSTNCAREADALNLESELFMKGDAEESDGQVAKRDDAKPSSDQINEGVEVEASFDQIAGCPTNYIPTNFGCPMFPQLSRDMMRKWGFPTVDNDLSRKKKLDDGKRYRRFMICGMARPNVQQNPACGSYSKPEQRSSTGAIDSIVQRAHGAFSKRKANLQAADAPVFLVSLDGHEMEAIKEAARRVGWGHVSRYVMKDFTSPTRTNLANFVDMVLENEPLTHFIVHCGGGMGRTGLFLIALYTKIFKLSFSLASGKADVPPWTEPLREALAWVQANYHPKAGEFEEVKGNIKVLAEYAQSLYH